MTFRGIWVAVTIFICLTEIAFRSDGDIHSLAGPTQMKLNSLFNNNNELIKVKHYEILVTDDGFVKYRKTFPTGKQEYYSFNLLRLNSLGYLGNNTRRNFTIKNDK